VRTRDRPEDHFLHVFRLAEGTFETALPHGYMPDLMKLRSLYARFREDDDYEYQTLARDLYARPVLEEGRAPGAQRPRPLSRVRVVRAS
jgi:hypothetical protein